MKWLVKQVVQETQTDQPEIGNDVGQTTGVEAQAQALGEILLIGNVFAHVFLQTSHFAPKKHRIYGLLVCTWNS